MRLLLPAVLLFLPISVCHAGNAQWITAPEALAKRADPTSKPTKDPLANTWTCYRRTFTLDAVPTSAPAKIAADSRYWLWVNGKLIVFEGSLKRGPNRKDSYVDTVDLAPHLVPGKNTIALLAWYFGREGMSHLSSGMPGLYFDSEVAPASDGKWKVLVHPALGMSSDPQPNWRLPEWNVRFDATKDIGAWMESAFDDSSWAEASAMGKPPRAPWGELVDRPIPLFRFSELRDYRTVTPGEKVTVGKLPYDAQVTPYLKIDAPAGLVIDMRTDSYMTGGEACVRSEYVTKAGVQEFESPAWMSGHEVRYTVPPGVKVIALKYRESGYDCDIAGSFECDDPFFNTLWKKSARTLYVNMRDTYYDCPDRERAQWWGDIVIDTSETYYSLDRRADKLIAKGLKELMAWQRPDGTLFAPIPAGNWNQELPAQMLQACGTYGTWNYYLNTGDVETIKAIYPAVKRYLAVWKLGEDGLVVHRKGEWDWLDWGQNIDVPPLDNAWYYLALQSARDMAKLIGENNDIAGYEQQMQSIRDHYDAAFWRGKEYRSRDYKGDTDDRANAMAYLSGLAGLRHHDDICHVLSHHHNASPGMEKYILEAQCRMGQPGAAQARIKKRYKTMVESPLTTLWEFWDLSGSYNHPWAGGVLTVLSQYIAGITPTAPAWERFEIQPRLGDLKSIDATVPTTKGPIRVSIRRDEKKITLKLDAPPGTSGRVFLGDKTFKAAEGASEFEAPR
jgi:hypothetical protein